MNQASGQRRHQRVAGHPIALRHRCGQDFAAPAAPLRPPLAARPSWSATHLRPITPSKVVTPEPS
jgi:hypothetical protein